MKHTDFGTQLRHLDWLFVVLLGLALFLAGCGGGSGSSDSGDGGTGSRGESLTLAELGERIFFDTNLSNPVGQSCGTCHDPDEAFSDNENTSSTSPVSDGADGVSFGSRNAPTAGYAAFIPAFSAAPPTGGQFLDGRADTLEDQARAPFLNPVEMGMEDEAAVVAKLAAADYADDFRLIFSIDDFSNVTVAYTQMVTAIAAFERTAEFSPFNSKFDAVMAASESFTLAEARGQALFNGKAQCRPCHNSGGGAQVFSDFRYTNIGVPANPVVAGMGVVDLGLGAPEALNNAIHEGKFRTPTLRNVEKTAPYMHNGVFDTLDEVMNFYNRRDLDGVTPEVVANVDNRGNLGELNLGAGEIQDVIAFLKTLSDR
jgi:cytochrome c peroxidase